MSSSFHSSRRREAGAAMIGIAIAFFMLALGYMSLLALYSTGWQRAGADRFNQDLARERACAAADSVLARVALGDIDLSERLDTSSSLNAGDGPGSTVWPRAGDTGIPTSMQATATVKRLGATSSVGGQAWPWARIEATGRVTERINGVDRVTERTIAIVVRPEVSGSPGIFGEHGYIGRGRIVLSGINVDAVDTRLGSAASQALGARTSDVLGFGQIVLQNGTHIYGDVMTSYEQTNTGADISLTAEGWLPSGRRRDEAIVLNGSSSQPVVVDGDVRATRGVIRIDRDSTIHGAASTNGIDESGLAAGNGFTPNTTVDGIRTFNGGAVDGGIDENGPSVLGEPLAHDEFIGDLVAEAQQIAIESGAGVVTPGADGIAGTSDDVFRMGDYVPVLADVPDSTWTAITSGNNNTVNGTATIGLGGLTGAGTVKTGSTPVTVGNETTIKLNSVTLGSGESLTINTGTDPTKTLTLLVKSGLGLNSTSALTTTGAGKLNIILNSELSPGNSTRVTFGHTGKTSIVANRMTLNGGLYGSNPTTPGHFTTVGDLAVHTRGSGSINIEGNASVSVGGNASFSTEGGEFRAVGTSTLTIQGTTHVELPNSSTPDMNTDDDADLENLGDGSFRIEGTATFHGNLTVDADTIWFKQGCNVTMAGDENRIFSLQNVTFGRDSDVSEPASDGNVPADGSGDTTEPPDVTDTTPAPDAADDANIHFEGGAIQVYVNLGGENRTDGVNVRNGASFHGAIFAPYSRIGMGGRTASFVGAAIGERLIVSRGLSLRHDLALGTIRPGTDVAATPPVYLYSSSFFEPSIADPSVVGD